MSDLGPEDDKLLTLARTSRARSGSVQGAAVRDGMGRTYTAATVTLPSLSLSALRLAVAMAVSSGSTGLEAAAVVGEQDSVLADDLAAVRDVAGAGIPVYLAAPDGAVRGSVHT